MDHALSTEMTSDNIKYWLKWHVLSPVRYQMCIKKKRLPNPARNTGVRARVYVFCINADNYSENVCIICVLYKRQYACVVISESRLSHPRITLGRNRLLKRDRRINFDEENVCSNVGWLSCKGELSVTLDN
jgi:hypothetical protein